MTSFLLSSAGRRGALVDILRGIAHANGGTVTAVDASSLSAACHLADQFEVVPRVESDEFIDAVLEVAVRHRADVIIPTIDPEIERFSRQRDQFAEQGIDVWAPSVETARLCFDKWELFSWLTSHGLPTVQTFLATDLEWKRLKGSVVVKPRSGSGSIGVIDCASADSVVADLPDTFIVESQARGVELTVDFAVGRDGRFLGAVPRHRLETRAGEVSKGVTVHLPEIEDLTESIAKHLPGMYGVGNVQVFFDAPTGDIAVIEVNPRFGGGYPLTHAAGADLITAMLKSSVDADRPSVRWEAGVTMLRYDAAVFLRNDETT